MGTEKDNKLFSIVLSIIMVVIFVGVIYNYFSLKPKSERIKEVLQEVQKHEY